MEKKNKRVKVKNSFYEVKETEWGIELHPVRRDGSIASSLISIDSYAYQAGGKTFQMACDKAREINEKRRTKK